MLTELLLHFTKLPLAAQIVIIGGSFQALMFGTLAAADWAAGRIR